jgi:hypothetical protein
MRKIWAHFGIPFSTAVLLTLFAWQLTDAPKAYACGQSGDRCSRFDQCCSMTCSAGFCSGGVDGGQ